MKHTLIGAAQKYNGWSSYETWATALWINNEQGSQEYAYELVRTAQEEAAEKGDDSPIDLPIHDRTVRILVERLEDWVTEEMIPDLGATLAADLLGAAVSEIDWYELAKSFIEDFEE